MLQRPLRERLSVERELVWLFEFFDQGGDDFEKVAYHAVIGDFEDRGVLVFVNGGDGAGAFHADDVLDGATDAESEVELGRDGLAGAADLAIHGEPAFVADRARGAEFAAHGFGQFFSERNIFRRLDAAADADKDWALREVDGLLGFAEKLAGLGANLLGLQVDGCGLHWRFAAGVLFCEVGTEGAGLKRGDPGRVSGENDVGDGAALKHLADKDELSALFPIRGAIADHSLPKRRGESGREVADLIGVWEKDEVGLARFDDLL